MREVRVRLGSEASEGWRSLDDAVAPRLRCVQADWVESGRRGEGEEEEVKMAKLLPRRWRESLRHGRAGRTIDTGVSALRAAIVLVLVVLVSAGILGALRGVSREDWIVALVIGLQIAGLAVTVVFAYVFAIIVRGAFRWAKRQ